MNIDLARSYTHTRERPKTNPPTTREKVKKENGKKANHRTVSRES